MSYVKFETTIDKPIAGMPQLDAFVGRKVEVIVLDTAEQAGDPSTAGAPRPRRQGGWAKGEIWMSPDFDAPLEEFKDYM